MPRKAPTTITVFLILLCLAFYSLLLSRSAISSFPSDLRFLPQNLTALYKDSDSFNHVIREDINELTRRTRLVTSIKGPVDSFSVLLPNWEVLVLVYNETPLMLNPGDGGLYCIFPRNESSPANFSGMLTLSGAFTFKCILPNRNRRLHPFRQPVLARFLEKEPNATSASPVMPRWDYLAYECFSAEADVVVFVKGVNHRQGINKSPEEFSCVFGDDIKNAVRTAVTSSKQEVFRCHHPVIASAERIKVSIEIRSQKLVVPSVAYYTTPPRRTPSNPKPKSLLCATTMVYNVAKFLREWVMYYSVIGVDKFILYDNGSDDNLQRVVKVLNEEGDYNIERTFWVWPKTQEAGFSHSAVYFKDSCAWMMYVDVDEFIFSPSWLKNSYRPSKTMLKSLLSTPSDRSTGQVSIKCNDFGPSDQKNHPETGVMQGYNCRRQTEQRHKSIILLEAVDHSLLNVIHHFDLNDSYYSWKELPLEAAVINHYKYQAWPEFMNKFRRRVSAFVADWRTRVNPMSKDRTPGLGFQPIKPDGWEKMFCDVKDERLKILSQKWFGSETAEGFKMAWQR
ncbi:putative Ser/Thr-rich protein T10 in DGCR region [Hibiscus syriacus]|uniref:Glycosyltransferase family 92 protein n=1 Tax=Hibiscus syriacus TaxID=106335 RepID=A0A6A2YM07_HIBSY|nr:glycosyltransferase family 92 protein At1g27200-like [Hibiscus syriacus]KAE8680373.1 putative Ser/Thr-rich protein T10 in DGCR region [Hibiscus syriacus]